MKKLFISAMLLSSMAGFAQETYSDANLATEDLNGTARYVGMGGAMEALGADISTINTNPAGVGLFRKSQVSMSFGLNSQADAVSSPYTDATKMSFDQVGFVWSNQYDVNRYVNFGFNYKKSRNFNNILDVSGDLDVASQNCLSYMKLMGASDIDDLNLSQLDALYYNAFILDDQGYLGYNAANRFNMHRGTSGYIGDYDFNVSGNVGDRVYLGLTLGIKDVHYKDFSCYTEGLINSQDQSIGNLSVYDERRITGTGANIKFGTIFFPIEDSPLRIGLNISTPTWYDLTTENKTYLVNNANTGVTTYNPNYVAGDRYNFAMYTPWKFGASIGHTIDNYIALGASYEYSDYGYVRSRYYEGGYDDRSYNDVDMNDVTEKTLKGVSTLKIGAEVKATPEVSIRLGYNYVSPMYREGSLREPYTWSDGNYYSSTADYTNWKSTNRITCGVGYSVGAFAIDLAYQYSATTGEFHAFPDSYADITYDDGYVESIDNYCDGVDVSKKHHQLIATLSYKF